MVVGVVGRKGTVEGVISFNVAVDGSDATEMIIRAFKGSRFKAQVKAIALNGVTFAGLNVVDIARLRDELMLPVIAITRKRPRKLLLKTAIKRKGAKASTKTFERLSKAIKIRKLQGYYAQFINNDCDHVQDLMPVCLEMLRLAHMIASGIVTGESNGRI
jgi:endonuclease V-like protein UPF0215 family